MARTLFMFCVAAMLTMAAGVAMADSIQGRLGVTGRIGFINPADSDIGPFNVETDTDFIGGGGFIYGVTENIATELDITHANFGADGGVGFDVTNISLGAQYRLLNLPVRHLVPYAGVGFDILLNDINGVRVITNFADPNFPPPPAFPTIRRVDEASVDDTVGVHLSAGVDYFFQRQLAITAEMKGVIALDADITAPGIGKVGNFDPSSFSMTYGVRYFFN